LSPTYQQCMGTKPQCRSYSCPSKGKTQLVYFIHRWCLNTDLEKHISRQTWIGVILAGYNISYRSHDWAGTGAGNKRKAKGAMRSLWKNGSFFYTGQSKSNASYLLCHAIYKLDIQKFQRTSPQHCWKAYLFFNVVSIFADNLLPTINKSIHSHPVKVTLHPLQSLTQGILQCLVIYIMVYSKAPPPPPKNGDNLI
jgi:hypothetical protein